MLLMERKRSHERSSNMAKLITLKMKACACVCSAPIVSDLCSLFLFEYEKRRKETEQEDFN
jgi:hypothetical protein